MNVNTTGDGSKVVNDSRLGQTASKGKTDFERMAERICGYGMFFMKAHLKAVAANRSA